MLLIITTFSMKVKDTKKKVYQKYLNTIKAYINDIINDHMIKWICRIHFGNTISERKTSSEWKIQLTMQVNFISSKEYDETRTIHAESNNVEIMMGTETNEIVKELFKESLLQRYEEGLEE